MRGEAKGGKQVDFTVNTAYELLNLTGSKPSNRNGRI